MDKEPYSVTDDVEFDRSWGLYNCRDIELLGDLNLDQIMVRALRDSHIDTFDTACNKFPPPGGGVTAVVIIGASRADAHCWPEVGTMLLGCFSCGDNDNEVYDFVYRMIDQAQPEYAFEIPERKLYPRIPLIIPPTWISMLPRSRLKRLA